MVRFDRARFEAAWQVLRLCNPVAIPELPPGGVHLFETLASTNQTAWELFNQSASQGTVVLALEQTAGRGQWGRQWVSSTGGLYLSVLLTPNLAIEHCAQLTLCTAWGIAIALRELPGRLSGVSQLLPIQIKWLNDLVLQGRKLGGILTETRIQQGRITKAVVGVGINWTNPVPEPGIRLRSFLETQPTPLIESLEMLAAITLHGLLWGYQRWQQGELDSILQDYFALLMHRDRPLLIDGRTGTIVGIAPTGDLRVRLQSAESGSAQGVQSTLCEEVLLKPSTISLGYDS